MRGLAPVLCAALLCGGCSSDGDEAASQETSGSRIAFVAGGDGFVYTVDKDGRDLRRLTRGKAWGAERATWSPDGSRLAVVNVNVPQGYSRAVVLMNADGGTARKRLTLLRRSESQLRWRTPGAIQVLDNEWPNKTVVSEVPVAGGRLRRIGREPQGALSPDGGRWVIVKGDYSGADSQIYVTSRDGSRAVNISRSRSVGPRVLQETTPVWSPDGSRIAYVFDRGRGTEVWVMRADGSEEKRVAWAPLTRAGPDWSPDGRFLAYEADVDDDGMDEIYVVSAEGGRPRKVVEMNYVQDLDWQPSRHQRTFAPAPPLATGPRKPVRTFTYQLAQGAQHLADVRLLRTFGSDRDRPNLADLSPDGSLVALFNREGLALLDLRSNRLRPFATPRTPRASPRALFSPDGRLLLYRAWDQLLVRDVATGVRRTVGRTASGGFSWLRDSRVVFADDRGTLWTVRPGERARRLRVPRVDRFAITPDGRRLVYERRCETFLLDRRSGRRKRLSGHLFVPEGAWAPDGSYFVLQWAEECDRNTAAIWAYHSHDVLFSQTGRRLAETGGHGATWSRDSQLVLVYPHPTGTAVGGLQGLVAIDPRRRRESTILPTGNAYSQAFVGPGRWIVYSVYRFPDRVSYTYTAGGLYIGRIVDAGR